MLSQPLILWNREIRVQSVQGANGPGDPSLWQRSPFISRGKRSRPPVPAQLAKRLEVATRRVRDGTGMVHILPPLRMHALLATEGSGQRRRVRGDPGVAAAGKE